MKKENGYYTIIDYKSGKPNINDWFGDRPKQPQLPLYCIKSIYRRCAGILSIAVTRMLPIKILRLIQHNDTSGR